MFAAFIAQKQQLELQCKRQEQKETPPTSSSTSQVDKTTAVHFSTDKIYFRVQTSPLALLTTLTNATTSNHSSHRYLEEEENSRKRVRKKRCVLKEEKETPKN